VSAFKKKKKKKNEEHINEKSSMRGETARAMKKEKIEIGFNFRVGLIFNSGRFISIQV
jgi:hypothetical protein